MASLRWVKLTRRGRRERKEDGIGLQENKAIARREIVGL